MVNIENQKYLLPFLYMDSTYKLIHWFNVSIMTLNQRRSIYTKHHPNSKFNILDKSWQNKKLHFPLNLVYTWILRINWYIDSTCQLWRWINVGAYIPNINLIQNSIFWTNHDKIKKYISFEIWYIFLHINIYGYTLLQCIINI